jgi:hypothetical protein
MKLKYYLRGAGVGVIVTTLVLMIAFAFHKTTMSDAEVIARAKQLGMVEATEGTGDTDDTDDKENTKDAAGEGSSTDAENDTENPKETVSFTISSGETSAVVSQHLQEQGLVDNGDSFDMFISDVDLDNSLLPGTYEIPKGSSFLEIAQILTTKSTRE